MVMDVCPACHELFAVLSTRARQQVRTTSEGLKRFVVIDDDWRLAHVCDVSEPGPALEAQLQLRSAKTLHEVHTIVRSAARGLVRADGATFVLRNGDQCVYIDEDALSPLWRGQRFPISDCISGWAMLNNEYALVPDITSDERIPLQAYRPTFVKSLLMMPIGHAGDTFGAIGTYWARPHRATHHDVATLRDLSDVTADALDRIGLPSMSRSA